MARSRKLKPYQQLTFPFYREPLKPSDIKQLPLMTNLEFFWGSPEQIDDNRYWFRAFKPLPGKPYQGYFHIYTWMPIRSAHDLRKIISQCVRESFQTRTHGSHEKIVIQCCPDKYWDPIQEKCIEDRPRLGKRPLFYKVLIPEKDLKRLLRVGKARRAKQKIRGIKISAKYLIKNPDSRLQELEEQWNLYPNDINIFRTLNRERIRTGLDLLTLPPSLMYSVIKNLLEPTFWGFSISGLQFPAFEIRKNILDDNFPIVPENEEQINTLEQILRNIAPQFVELGWVVLLSQGKLYKGQKWKNPIYPQLFIVPQHVIKPSDKSIISILGINGELIADQWAKDEDPRVLTHPELRRGSYPAKYVLYKQQKIKPTNIPDRPYVTWQYIIPYENDDNEGRAPFIAHGHYGLSTLKKGLIDYLIRLLKLNSDLDYEIFYHQESSDKKRRNPLGKIAFHEQWRGIYGSGNNAQTYHTLYAYDPSDPELSVYGYVDFSIWKDKIHLEMIETRQPYRRQGIGTALYKELLRLHPMLVKWGMLTPEGMAFHDAMLEIYGK